MSLATNIVESMAVAAIFSPSGFLAVCVAGGLSAFLGFKGNYVWGLITLAIAGGIMWAISLQLSAQCTSCNYVDRIYHMEIRWGLLFWLVLFAIGLSLMKLRQNYRKKI